MSLTWLFSSFPIRTVTERISSASILSFTVALMVGSTISSLRAAIRALKASEARILLIQEAV